MAKIIMVVMNNFISDTRIIKEANSLVSDGHSVTVIAMKTPQAVAYEKMGGFDVHRLFLRTRQWPKWIFVQAIKYLEFMIKSLIQIKQSCPDVVHSHDLPALPIAWLASILMTIKTIYDSHEFWLGLNRPIFRTKFGKWIVRQVEGFLIQRVNSVITINQTIAEQLAQIYGVPLPVIVMNAQKITNPPQSDKLQSLLNIEVNTFVVIYAASFQPGRGLEQLIESTQYFEENMLLILMGPDKMNGRLQDFTQVHGWQSRVHFLPPVPQDEVAIYVASSDLGVIPSQSTSLNGYFGLGNKIFHYIAAGVPIAVSDQPERKRIVDKFRIGVTFDSSNPRDIAKKIVQVMKDPQEAQRMRERARQAHLTELNWENEAQKLFQIYQELESK